jgi:hypothetical protein
MQGKDSAHYWRMLSAVRLVKKYGHRGWLVAETPHDGYPPMDLNRDISQNYLLFSWINSSDDVNLHLNLNYENDSFCSSPNFPDNKSNSASNNSMAFRRDHLQGRLLASLTRF